MNNVQRSASLWSRRGLKINVVYDSSTATAPLSWFTMVEAGKVLLEQAAPNVDCMVNIVVGYGHVAGIAMPGGAIGETSAGNSFSVTWDVLLNAFIAHGHEPR